MKTERVKGFNDYTGKEAKKREKIKSIIAEFFRVYGFEPAETPVIEYEEFVRGENPQDEAVSDIFKLQDRGKRKLALRYEFTFQLKRIAQNKKLPYKRYQIGPVFRDEPVSANRFRQFVQADADTIGLSKTPEKDEAEILAMVRDILNAMKIKFTIYINNRKLLNEILDEFKIKNKESVIRIIDKLDKLPYEEVKKQLKSYKAEKLLEIFKQKEEFFKKYESYKEIEELKKYCRIYGVEVEFLSSLARGLSYYTGSVFEVKTKKMKETICSGGRYVVNRAESFGASFGIERLCSLADIEVDDESYLIISLNQDKEAIKIAQRLRKSGKSARIFYGKPSKALEYANSYNIPKVVFIGEKEIKEKKLKLRDMKTGKEKKISFDKKNAL